MSSDLSEGLASIFGSKSVSILVGLVVTPLLARILGGDLYGDYAFLMSVFGIAIIFVNAGTFDGLRKYVSPTKSRAWNTDILAFYLTLTVALTVVIGAVFGVLLATGTLARRFGTEFEGYFVLLVALVVGRQFFAISRATLMGFRAERYSETLHILRRVLFAVGGVGLAYYGLNVTGVLLGDLIATVAAAVLGLTLVARRVDLGWSFGFNRSRVSLTDLVGFNAMNVVLILLTASLYHTDIILLHLFEGSRSTGYYKAALVVAEFLWLVPTVIQMALLQSTSVLWDRDESDRISALASRITRFNYLFTQLLAVGIAVLAVPFVGLYFGPEFLPAAAFVPILVVGALGFAISRPIISIGQSKGALRPLIAATGFAALLNLVLNLLLIPPFGATGAAVATSIGYGVMIVLHVGAARRIGYDPVRDLRLGRGLAVGAGTAGVLLAASRVLGDPLVQLAVLPPLGFAVYLALALAVGAVRLDELAELRASAPI